MDEHPAVFRDGETGRRAVLIGGPDVREVIWAVKSARATEPELDATGVVAPVERNTGAPARLVDTAVRYWATYPDEVRVRTADVEAVEAEAFAAWERQRNLLAR